MVFERFTDELVESIQQSQKERHLLRRNYLGTDVLLLGLFSDPSCTAAKALNRVGISLALARQCSVELDLVQEDKVLEMAPFSVGAKNVMTQSWEKAHGLGDLHIDTGHFLLALMDEREETGASDIFRTLGTDLKQLRFEILRLWRNKSTNLYELLQVDQKAQTEVINQAYKSLSEKYHPEQATGDKGMYIRIINAWSLLSNDVLRAAYDQAVRDSETKD